MIGGARFKKLRQFRVLEVVFECDTHLFDEPVHTDRHRGFFLGRLLYGS